MSQPSTQLLSPRIFAFDVMKSLAIVGVVYLHASELVVNNLLSITSPTGWLMVTTLNASWRWSVPVLLMVSGALALDSTRSSRLNYIRNRLFRLSVALTAGIMFQSVTNWFTTGSSPSVSQLMHALIFDQPYGYLYFLCILLLLTPFTPRLSTWLSKLNRQQSLIVTGLALIVSSAVFSFSRFVLLLLPTYLGFFMAGRTLQQCKLSQKRHVLLAILSIIGIASISTFALYLEKTLGLTSVWTQQYITYMQNASPGVIVMSIFAYSMMLSPIVFNWIKKRSQLSSGVSLIAKYSLGIYLLHVPIMQLIRFFIPQIEAFYISLPLVTTLLVVVSVVGLSLALSFLLSRFSIGKMIVS